ncbi:MAG: hypothetical protein QM756_08260 [Polyangiaceae bacterium]
MAQTFGLWVVRASCACLLATCFVQCGGEDRTFHNSGGSSGDAGAAGDVGQGGVVTSGGTPSIEGGAPTSQGGTSGGNVATGGDGGGAGDTATGGDGGAGGAVGTGGKPNTGGVTGTGGADTTLACASKKITTSGTALASASNAGTSHVNPSCGSASAPDYLLEWVAPSAGYYSLNARGSDFASTVLGVFKPDCANLTATTSQLGCNNAVVSGNGMYADVLRKFTAGEHALVALEGYLGQTGTVMFNAEPVTCPSAGSDVSAATFPFSSTTTGGTNTHTGACGGMGFPERAFLWEAPSDGVYEFSVVSSNVAPVMRPALYVESGPRCGGTLLGCNASDGNTPGAASVTRFVRAGDALTLIVDSLSAVTGAFQLNVKKKTTACPEVPAKDLSGINLTDVVLDSKITQQVAASCTESGSAYFYPQHSYGLTVNLAQGLSCSITLQSDGALSAFLLQGTKCEGSEVASSCKQSTCTGTTCTLRFSFNPTQNGSYVLVVQGAAQSNIGAFGSAVTFSTSTACVI